MLASTTTQDTANVDGSVTRITTTTWANGDTLVKTHTFTADAYQAAQTDLQNQVADLQTQIAAVQAVVTQSQNNIVHGAPVVAAPPTS